MAFNLSMNASDIDKTLVESRQLLDSEPATKQYVDEAVANAGGSGGVVYVNFTTTDGENWTPDKTFAEVDEHISSGKEVVAVVFQGEIYSYFRLEMYIPQSAISFGIISNMGAPAYEQLLWESGATSCAITSTYLAVDAS